MDVEDADYESLETIFIAYYSGTMKKIRLWNKNRSKNSFKMVEGNEG